MTGNWVSIWICFLVLGCSACSDNNQGSSQDGASQDGASTDAASTDSSDDSTGQSDADADTDTYADSGWDFDGNVPHPERICASPISLYDTTNPTSVVGTGTPESCTEAALRIAAAAGGIITFDCGPAPITIHMTETIELPNHTTTIIDGGGRITLDAGGRTRHFYFSEPDWMNNPDGVVLQRLIFQNGKAPAMEYYDQDPNNPQCAWGYADGSGGVLYVRNGVVHIIDCDFYNNEAALIGPDVGGGAIYVVGVPELIISDSTFVGNRASNGGAVGMLFCGNPGIYNTLFENNSAEGTGQNGCCDDACVGVGHENQTGAGGNSGALYMDGLNDADTVFSICGTVFRNNHANELGGALFRTPNVEPRKMLIDKCVFDGNTAYLGGVSFIRDHELTVRNTTVMNNSAEIIGGIWVNSGTMDVENCTAFNNHPTGFIVDNGGTITNSTIVDSILDGPFTVTNSILTDMSCADTKQGSHNLQWPEGNACAQGVTFADPNLGDMGDHGGATPTMVPGAAADGVGTGCPVLDQRGETRNVALCTAGAVEI
ncbi:MAG: hypothetical protein JXX14_05765 [Deltaproteobacteria bacterium]|nr:hypothetical protein [Deltaproteobacteria bacterium]